MYHLLITVSALLFSLQFLFNSRFQEKNGSGWNASLVFLLYTSVAGLILLLLINKLRLEITLFSVIVAFVYSVVLVALNYSSIKAFEYANLSIYSIFSMIGGMLLPFVYGLFCGEQASIVRIAACLLIAISAIIPVDVGENSKRAIKYYIGVFLLNGMVGVISKLHQSSAHCTDSASFLMLTKILTVLLVILLILTTKEKRFWVSKRSLLYCGGNAVFNSIGNLLLLVALLHLPASVQYPMVTGGTIVFSIVIDKLRGIKVSKKAIIAAGIALISTVARSIW